MQHTVVRAAPDVLQRRFDANVHEVRYGVKEVLDVPYHAFEQHKKGTLDIYVPLIDRSNGSAPARLPVVVFVHGGGWKKGGSRHFGLGLHQNVGRSLAECGYVCVLPNYRLSTLLFPDILILQGAISCIIGCCYLAATSSETRSTGSVLAAFLAPLALLLSTQLLWRRNGAALWPDHARDVAEAVAWTQLFIGQYGGDPSNMSLVGHSAGGHICSMLLWQPQLLREGQDKWNAAIATGHAHTASFTHDKPLLHQSEHHAASGASAPAAITTPLRWRCGVLMSPVLSGYMLSGQDRLDAGHWWTWPAALARRAAYMRPVFGRNPAGWESAFPDLHSRDPAAILALNLPPLMIVNAERDWTLDTHTDTLEPKLVAAVELARSQALSSDAVTVSGSGARAVPQPPASRSVSIPHFERVSIKHTDHIGYVVGIGRGGSAHRPVCTSSSSSSSSSASVVRRSWLRNLVDPLWAGQEIALPTIAEFMGRYAGDVEHRLAFAVSAPSHASTSSDEA